MIRDATDDDLPLVRAMWTEFSTEIPDEPWRDSDLQEDLEWLATAVREEVVLLADDAGLAIAVKKGAKLGKLEVLYVRLAARGGGLARELTKEVATRLRERGAEVLELDVLASNEPARAVYERWGFRTSELTLAAPLDALEGRLSSAADGPTFGYVHVQSDDEARVRRDAAKVLRSDPEVSVSGGWVRVRADVTDEEPTRLKDLARELSYTIAGVTLALGVERGSVVRYNLFDRGSDVDEYLSVPEFYGALPPGDVYAMGANATVVARLTGADAHSIRDVARTAASAAELPPAQELYEQIAGAMGVEP
ncbi:MAG TPA: GNAT family N-acetyltransferase [Gaiellaceae bacterium]|nr:GNAT family N-acetyltransferase [Gaiellaceae bacterium]